MKLATLLTNARKFIQSNDSEILTAFGMTGVSITAYLAAKAGYRSYERLRYADEDSPIKEKVLLVWDLYIPAAVAGTITTTCVLGASRANSQRTTAAVTAYSIAENTFAEYRGKVAEEIGARKEQGIRDKVVQDHIQKNPPDPKSVIITESGNVLCCEAHTGRYFRSNMETLRKSQNDINVKIINELYVTLDEFYYLIGLPSTPTSNRLGWDSNKILELIFTAAMGPNSEPCLSFDYNYIKPL